MIFYMMIQVQDKRFVNDFCLDLVKHRFGLLVHWTVKSVPQE